MSMIKILKERYISPVERQKVGALANFTRKSVSLIFKQKITG